MNLTKKSLEILKSFENTQNIQSVADMFGTTYAIIRNNNFKHYWRRGYLNRVGKGLYVLSDQGMNKIKETEELYEIDELILTAAKQGKTNEEIIQNINDQYGKKTTHSAVYSKIYHLKSKHPILNRRRNRSQIPTVFSEDLAEFFGLLISDGSYNQYNVSYWSEV